MGDQKYDVTDFGALCGYKIELGGTLVWTGALSGRGYETRTTTLPEDTLKEVLRLARVGDQREAAKAGVAPDAPQAPPSAAPKSETRAKPTRAARVEPKRKAPAKPKPKPTAPKSAGGAAAPAPASAPKAEHKSAPPPKRRSRKAASSRSGPPTQRTPAQPTAASTPAQPTHAAPPAAKPRGRRAATKMDDKAVLDGLMKKLRKEDPSTADHSFTALKRIWLGGGREATAAWMNVHKFPSAVDAFSDWMEKHFEAAQTMLEKAPHSAPKSAKVA